MIRFLLFALLCLYFAHNWITYILFTGVVSEIADYKNVCTVKVMDSMTWRSMINLIYIGTLHE